MMHFSYVPGKLVPVLHVPTCQVFNCGIRGGRDEGEDLERVDEHKAVL